MIWAPRYPPRLAVGRTCAENDMFRLLSYPSLDLLVDIENCEALLPCDCKGSRGHQTHPTGHSRA
jgi:hypothetical protein